MTALLRKQCFAGLASPRIGAVPDCKTSQQQGKTSGCAELRLPRMRPIHGFSEHRPHGSEARLWRMGGSTWLSAARARGAVSKVFSGAHSSLLASRVRSSRGFKVLGTQ
ncbi:hypothetical protein CBOM_05462 [Ceraceosorus bombacis]|uniref:Uncharacterized protein n=1 Tax=Ceraceosorus bombacis TaxID=401625 RepID=A0A0P1BS43_9BASI|nr:hypothetical protein CBOM_05462 [Ceraceosorus bombacis]